MIQTCTPDDVLRYAYDETTPQENQLIEDALAQDQELLTMYLDIVDLQAGLNKAMLSPSARTTNNILAYACPATYSV